MGGYRLLVRTGGFPLQRSGKIGIPKFPTLSATLSPPPTSLHFAAGIGRCTLGEEEERTTPLSLGPLSKSHLATQDEHGRTMSPPPLLPYSPFCLSILTLVAAAFNTYHPPLLPLFSLLLLLLLLLRLTSSLEKGNFCGGHERAVGENGRDR